MLCLQTANNNGELASRVGEMIIPYDPDKIARDTKYFSKDTVIVAMELFKKLNLIYTDDGICLKIAGFENMVGSETGWAKQTTERYDRQTKTRRSGTLWHSRRTGNGIAVRHLLAAHQLAQPYRGDDHRLRHQLRLQLRGVHALHVPREGVG